MAVVLTGCPSTTSTQRQQAAQASQNITIALLAAQKADVAAHDQGLYSDADHVFIEQQFLTIARLDKATNACILKATDTPGTVVCLSSATDTLDQINAEGGSYLKSDHARLEFASVITGIRTTLASIAQVLK
jgi:hypothetical protein